MRLVIVAVLALAGCSSQGVRQIGFYEYLVTMPQGQVWPTANETCAKVGRLIASAWYPDLASSPTGTHVPSRYERLKIQCAAPYEVIPVPKDFRGVWSEDAHWIWVPISEFPPLDGCETCVPPRPPTVQIRVKQVANDYCAKSNGAMKQTGGGFDLGSGLDTYFTCVPNK